MQIVEAKEQDADIIGYIHSTAWKQTYTNIFPTKYLESDNPQIRTTEFLSDCNDKRIHYYLLYEDKTAVGMFKVMVNANSTCEILSFYILAECRNKGYGKQVITYLGDVLFYIDIYLWVLADNIKARHFYEKNGFVLTGKTREINRGKNFIQFQYLKAK